MENGSNFEARMPSTVQPFHHPKSRGLWSKKITLRMTEDEVDLLLGVLKKNAESPYLEFGAGGSTLLAAGIVPQVISVENDLGFINLTRRQLMMRRKRSSPAFFHIDQGPVGPWGFPLTKDPAMLGRYAEQVWKEHLVPSNTATALIDGRFRRACLLHSALHLDSTVDILLHDANRYSDVVDEFFEKEKTVDNLVLMHTIPGFPTEKINAKLEEVQYDPD